MSIMRIVRDEDCPNCGWPETYVEGDEATGPETFGCSKCGYTTPIVDGVIQDEALS